MHSYPWQQMEVNYQIYPREEGGWVRPRAGLDATHKTNHLPLPGKELRFLGRLARQQVRITTELSRPVRPSGGERDSAQHGTEFTSALQHTLHVSVCFTRSVGTKAKYSLCSSFLATFS
jgi:hypothetical protein